jgi:hypothetical protein
MSGIEGLVDDLPAKLYEVLAEGLSMSSMTWHCRS